MSYIQAATDALVEELGAEHRCEAELVDLYTLLVLIKGSKCTLEDVHDAWAIWRANTAPGHPSLLPFAALDTDMQTYDEPYRDAIVRAARRVPLASADGKQSWGPREA